MGLHWPLSHDPERVPVLEPGHMERNYRADLWYYRELLLILSWRDIAVRYRQTTIGIAVARAGQKTLIVDADLRKLKQQRIFVKTRHEKRRIAKTSR